MPRSDDYAITEKRHQSYECVLPSSARRLRYPVPSHGGCVDRVRTIPADCNYRVYATSSTEPYEMVDNIFKSSVRRAVSSRDKSHSLVATVAIGLVGRSTAATQKCFASPIDCASRAADQFY